MKAPRYVPRAPINRPQHHLLRPMHPPTPIFPKHPGRWAQRGPNLLTITQVPALETQVEYHKPIVETLENMEEAVKTKAEVRK
ncbi:hypothetical protein HDV00_003268 [Rhizophlyctis rosea]|nr:hypothetical protein HDV00_003268 [Rhizophlyctis rosea]